MYIGALLGTFLVVVNFHQGNNRGESAVCPLLRLARMPRCKRALGNGASSLAVRFAFLSLS